MFYTRKGNKENGEVVYIGCTSIGCFVFMLYNAISFRLNDCNVTEDLAVSDG